MNLFHPQKRRLSEELAEADKPALVFKFVGTAIALIVLLSYLFQELECTWFAVLAVVIAYCLALGTIILVLYAVSKWVVLGVCDHIARCQKKSGGDGCARAAPACSKPAVASHVRPGITATATGRQGLHETKSVRVLPAAVALAALALLLTQGSRYWPPLKKTSALASCPVHGIALTSGVVRVSTHAEWPSTNAPWANLVYHSPRGAPPWKRLAEISYCPMCREPRRKGKGFWCVLD